MFDNFIHRKLNLLTITGKILIVLLLFISSKTFSQISIFEDGEELYYEVYYSFINIGWVKFNTTKVAGKKDTYLCYAKLKSNEGVPFVSVDFEFTSQMEIVNNHLMPIFFESKEFNDLKHNSLTYNFNYDSGFVDIKKIGYNGEIEYSTRKNLNNTIFQDGLSIFYFARFNYFNNQKINVPVLINQDSVSVSLDFNTQNTDVNIDEVKYDIASQLLEGSTDYELVFGLTGHFEGWFSNDNAKIPLKAKFNVKIGNVTLELANWKRQRWSPPKY